MKEIINSQIIAHRGDWGKGAPENSLRAFKRAVEKGLDIELDIHLTRDNTLAVFHDFSLLRMSYIPWLVYFLTKKQLKIVKLKSTDQYIPTLEEILELVKGKVTIFIEFKSMFRWKKLCNRTIEALKDYDGKVVFIGFNANALKYVQSKNLYPIAVSSFRPKKKFKGFFPDGVCVNIGGLVGARVKKDDYPIILSWTVNSKKSLDVAKKYSHAYIANTKKIQDVIKKYKKNDLQRIYFL